MKFARRYRIDYREMNPGQIVTFIEFLSETLSSPASILNYISSIKRCLRRMRRPLEAFEDYMVKDALTSVTSTIRHFPDPSQPISPHDLERVISNLLDPEATTIRCFLTVSFASIFRQSTITSRSVKDFDTTRQLCRDDVIYRDGHICIRHKWSKSDQSALSALELKKLPNIPGSVLCPTQAVLDMFNEVPTKVKSQALISFRDGGPMPVSYISGVWKKTTNRLGLTGRKYNLHCLRKGGSKYLQDSYGNDELVQCYGGWRAKKSLRSYIHDKANEKACRAFSALQKDYQPKPKLRR